MSDDQPQSQTTTAEHSSNATGWRWKQKYYQGTFKRELVMERGEGVRVWDADGNVYLDLVAGIATNVLGHAHPAVVRAIIDQAQRLIHVSNLYINERQVELAEQLYNVSGGMRSFFSNSGAEANEGAIKLARKFGRLNRDGAYEIISMERSFHGRTLATTAATGQKKYQDTWRPLPDGFKQVPFNDFDGAEGGGLRQDGRRADRGGAGRGRHPPRERRVHAGGARVVRRAEPGDDLRRGAGGHGSHRQVL